MVLTSSLAFAQKETGVIEGIVTDNEQRPVPGVAVTASSPSLIGGSASADTARDGSYRFPALAPGTYEVQAQLSGFQTVTRKDVRVFVGRTTNLDFSLEFLQTSEIVEVSEKAPLIDVTTSSASHTVPVEIIENVPKRGFIEDLMALTPGIGDDLVAHGGAEGAANALWIDGVDFDSPLIGGRFFSATPAQVLNPISTATIQYNYNWIQEAQVASLGAGPAYGGFTGAVANFITRSGSNNFHGLLETFFQNEHLISVNRPDDKQEPVRLYDSSVQLGGPILHDKLWFFSGVHYAYNERQPFGYDGNVTETYPKFITKLTYKQNENNTLQGFASYNYHKIDGDGAGPSTLPEATSIDTCHEASWNSTWISLLNSDTTFEGRFGGFWSDCKQLPRNGDIPGRLDFPPGISSVNAALTHLSGRLRPQVNAILSHHADNFLKGNHDFQFGVEWEDSTATEISRYNGGYFYYNSYGYPTRSVAPEGIWDLDTSNHRLSAFASDNWKILDQVTLDLGVRWDYNRGITDLGTVFKTDPVAPRLGLVWRSQGGYPTAVKVHYGDYYEALRGVFYATVSHGRKPTRDEVFESGEWLVNGSNPGIPATIDPNIKQPFVREFTLGADQEFANGIAVGAYYIRRTWENILSEQKDIGEWAPVPFVNPLTGETITIFSFAAPGDGTSLISNQAGLFRRYNGIELFVNTRVLRDFTLSASFDYSRIKGNVDNNSDSYTYVFASGASISNNPNRRINFEGGLVNDPSFAWKLVGTYKLPMGLNTGWYFRHESGDRWTPTIIVTAGRAGFIFLLPRGIYQLASRNILDLRVEKEFPLHRGRFRITADIFNLFNVATVTQVDRFYPRQGTPSGFTDARTLQLGLRYTF